MLALGKRKMTAKRVLSHKIDIKAGNMTFGQRIELGKIFSEKDNLAVKFEKTFECLHSYRPDKSKIIVLAPYFEEIINGLKHWSQVEEKMLKYQPTEEEKRAGISDLSKKIGEMGTIKSMAKDYSKDPDEILEWSYSKVFGILYTDLEENKYNRRYQKAIKK